jgi:hypothetical protein
MSNISFSNVAEKPSLKDFLTADFTNDGFVPGATSRFKAIPRQQRLAARANALSEFNARDFSGASAEDVGKAYTRAIRAGGGGRESNYDPLGNQMLANLLINRKHGIRFNPRLAAYPTATTWLNERASKNPSLYAGWDIQSGDYDNDPETPDNVIVRDAEGRWRVIDGVSLDAGTKKRLKQALYTAHPRAIDRKNLLTNSDPFALKMYKKWIVLSPKTKASYNNDANNYVMHYLQRKPNAGKLTPYQKLRRAVTNVLRSQRKDTINVKRLYIPTMAKTIGIINQNIKLGNGTLDQVTPELILKTFDQLYIPAEQQFQTYGQNQLIPDQSTSLRNVTGWGIENFE